MTEVIKLSILQFSELHIKEEQRIKKEKEDKQDQIHFKKMKKIRPNKAA